MILQLKSPIKVIDNIISFITITERNQKNILKEI